jgi:hypothetical protein
MHQGMMIHFFCSDNLCISHKRLFNSFTAVMDDFSAGAPVNDHSTVYVPKTVITGGEKRSTSIASVHGSRALRNAAAGRAATEAVVTPGRPSGPAAAAGGPNVPGATGTIVSPSMPMTATPCGPTALASGSALPRPAASYVDQVVVDKAN